MIETKWSIRRRCELGGGGGGGASSAVAAAPVPTPAPPVTQTNSAVVQAEQDALRENLIKKSVKNTMLAGDTGGYKPGGPNMAPTKNVGYKG